jgi:hypothetical protein
VLIGIYCLILPKRPMAEGRLRVLCIPFLSLRTKDHLHWRFKERCYRQKCDNATCLMVRLKHIISINRCHSIHIEREQAFTAGALHAPNLFM